MLNYNKAILPVFLNVLDELDLRQKTPITGRKPVTDEEVLLAYLIVLWHGCKWELIDQLPNFPSSRTCFRRLKKWREHNVFQLMLERVMPEPDQRGIIDATFMRGRLGGDGIGLTRHGKGSILQVIVNMDSIPTLMHTSPAGPGECKLIKQLLAEYEIELPVELLGDAAYDCDEFASMLNQRDCELIPKTSKRRLDYDEREKLAHARIRQRWPVERFFAWLSAWQAFIRAMRAAYIIIRKQFI